MSRHKRRMEKKPQERIDTARTEAEQKISVGEAPTPGVSEQDPTEIVSGTPPFSPSPLEQAEKQTGRTVPVDGS